MSSKHLAHLNGKGNNMKAFLHLVGALAIGLMIAAGVTFPAIAIGAVIGYFVIQEAMSKPSTEKGKTSSGLQNIFEDTRTGTW